MSTTTTNYGLHKIDLADAPPDITVLNDNWDAIDSELNNLKHEQTSCTGTGEAYEVSVSGIESLTAGVSFIFTPNVVSSEASPTINVNGLGAKNIRRRISGSTSTTVATGGAGGATNWLSANKPVMLIYDGNYWIADIPKPNMADVYGTLSIANGGTGASTAEEALINLGAIRSCVKAYLTGDASTNALHTLKVSAASPVILDNNSIFEIANDALKVKKAGYYLASAVVVFSIDSAAAANTYGFVQLIVNGGESVLMRQVVPSVTANVNMHLVPSLVWIPENAAIKVKVYIPVSGVKKTFSSSTNIYGSYVQLQHLG